MQAGKRGYRSWINELKLVSVEQIEHSIARALSRLIAKDYTVCVRDVEYKNEGAWIQLEVSPQLDPVLKSLFEAQG